MEQNSYLNFYLYKRVVEAKLFIDRNYLNKIDVRDIAEEACFSKFHFIRLFRKLYGKTPYQYLISLRVDEAKILLRNKESIQHVSYLVCFESPTSFSAIFKKITGLCPSAYQQQQLKRLAEIKNYPLKFIPGCFAEFNGWLNQTGTKELLSAIN